VTSASQPDPGERFFSGALDRIRRITLVLGVVASIAVWVRFGTGIAIGFVIGCCISYLNFHWLKKAISAIADRVTATGTAGSANGVVVRFMLRYGFIAIGCYVILMSSKSSVYGLLGGLFLSVAAILCEAAYEVAVALRRGI
jgi:ATP synthase I chain